MPDPHVDRALAEGARRSAEVAHRAPPPPEGWGAGEHRAALQAWGAQRLPAVWERHKRLIVGVGLFLLFDLVALIAAVTMGTHF